MLKIVRLRMDEQQLQDELKRWRNDTEHGGGMSDEKIDEEIKKIRDELDRIGNLAYIKKMKQFKKWAFQMKFKDSEDEWQERLLINLNLLLKGWEQVEGSVVLKNGWGIMFRLGF